MLPLVRSTRSRTVQPKRSKAEISVHVMGCCFYFRLLATAIFVTGVLPLLTVRGASKYVSTWHFIGPFSVGKTEIDGDPLYGYFDDGALGGEIQVGNNSQLVERQVMSEHVSGGQVYWSKIRGKGGYASLAPQTYDAKVQVDLNPVVQSTSSITIQESQGWLYGYLKGGQKILTNPFAFIARGYTLFGLATLTIMMTFTWE